MHSVKTFDRPLEDIKEAVKDIFEIIGDCTISGNIITCKGKNRKYVATLRDLGESTDLHLSLEVRKGIFSMFRKKQPFEGAEELERIWRYLELRLTRETTSLDGFIDKLLFSRSSKVQIPGGIKVNSEPGGIMRLKGKDGEIREILPPKKFRVEKGFIIFE
jgi:hypothetical protein